MNSLFLIYETYTNGFITDILDILSIFAIFCAILVIISKNPIVSVLFLIALFAGISSYLITLGLSFIGLSYLIVYIGAVSILFLFILMLINVRISELQSITSNSIPLAIAVGISFNYPIFEVLPSNVVVLRPDASSALFNHILVSFSNVKGICETAILDFKTYNRDIYFVTSKI